MEFGDIIELKIGYKENSNKQFILITKKYKVLKIYKKKLYEEDLFLCEELKTKFKECFQRFDILKQFGLLDKQNVKYKAHHKGARLPVKGAKHDKK